tara:strand:+ start:891 stop:1223 length:333 start_codon:yes stop_codon:yes gene_type:complete
MNGYSPPDPKDRKKFMFYDTIERQTDLKVRLHYDGLNQSQFFRLMITGYLEQDEGVMAFVHSCKNKLKIHNAKKRRGSEKEYSERQNTIKDFSLDEEEIENIFDIMEGDV